MKFLAAVVMSLALTGCWQEVSKNDIMRSVIICEKHGGVESIEAHLDGNEFVTCATGVRKRVGVIGANE